MHFHPSRRPTDIPQHGSQQPSGDTAVADDDDDLADEISCLYALIARVHGANMRPIWGREVPGGPHVGPMNFAISVANLAFCAGLY